MKFSYANKFIKIILFSKFDFFKPKKSKILIFDFQSTHLLLDYFNSEDVEFIYTRKERINLFVIFCNFIKIKFSTLDYFETYIKFANPNIVITSIDNATIFYKLKLNPHQKKIIIASTWRTPVDDFYIFTNENLKVKVIKDNSYYVDYIFTLNDAVGRLFKELGAEKVIPIGSFKSNHFRIVKNKKDLDIVYISSFNNFDSEKQITDEVDYKKYDNFQIILLQNILKYIKKNNSTVSVLGKKNNDETVKRELEYFNLIFKNENWNFIKSQDVNPYEIVDRAKIVITLNSTLGYESLSRGNKTIFFDGRSKIKSLETLKFAWPVEIFGDGPFWTSDLSLSSLEKIIDSLKAMSDLQWKILTSNYTSKIMLRNNNNDMFKSIIGKYI